MRPRKICCQRFRKNLLTEDQDSLSVTISMAELKGLMAEIAKKTARAALKGEQEKLPSKPQAASEQTLGALPAAPVIHGVPLMQPSTVPSLGPSLATSVSVEAVAPTVTAPSSRVEACIVGEGTTPMPARLIRLIQAQEYVDFAELLPDDLELLAIMTRAFGSWQHPPQSFLKPAARASLCCENLGNRPSTDSELHLLSRSESCSRFLRVRAERRSTAIHARSRTRLENAVQRRNKIPM